MQRAWGRWEQQAGCEVMGQEGLGQRRAFTATHPLRTQSVPSTKGTAAPWFLYHHFTLQRAIHGPLRGTSHHPTPPAQKPKTSRGGKALGAVKTTGPPGT